MGEMARTQSADSRRRLRRRRHRLETVDWIVVKPAGDSNDRPPRSLGGDFNGVATAVRRWTQPLLGR